ncbi:transmembrane protein 138 isoform X2 [Nannospalax galili]|uniref:transmembrane protein 138 isoform X2 n=1 Tax=Nannospalax galili TaxID=1026970 RepID=UPI00111C5572|nr:transmembrane protein 138 isoform X2 [Nannospalax galili]
MKSRPRVWPAASALRRPCLKCQGNSLPRTKDWVENQKFFSPELWNVPLGTPKSRGKMLQTSNYSLVLFLQFLLLFYDLFVNSFSELLRMAPVVQLVLFIIQDIAILFNIIIIFLMFFNTFIFQAGLVNLLFRKFKGTIILIAVYFALSISLHVWIMNLRWKNSNSFVWTDGLQTLFVFQRLVAVLYCYFYKRTAMRLGDPRLYQDSLWLRKEFMQVRRSGDGTQGLTCQQIYHRAHPQPYE